MKDVDKHFHRKYNVITMIKTLQKHGNSLAVVIDKPLLELMHLGEGAQVSLVLDGQNLVISPVSVGVGRERTLASAERIRTKYKATLEALAK